MALTDASSQEIKYLRKRLQEQGVLVNAETVAAWLKVRLDTQLVQVPEREQGNGGPGNEGGNGPAPETPGYWLIPARGEHGLSSEDHLRLWLDRGFWGFGPKTPGRKGLRKGDWVCFYAAKQAEVVAYARMAGTVDVPVTSEEWPESTPQEGVVYKVPLADVTWLQTRVKLDATIRARLDAYADRDPDAFTWGFFVQTTRKLSELDFDRLIGRE